MSEKTVSRRISAETKIIGQNFLRLRRSRGFTQRQIAEALQTSFQQIQKYEKGQNRISAEKLHELKLFFDVPYEYFFEGLSGDTANAPIVVEMLKTLCLKIEAVKDTARQKQICRAFLNLVS